MADSNQVEVLIPSASSILVSVPSHVDAVCEVKRQLSARLNCDATELRLTAITSEDAFSLPLKLQCTKRERQRNQTLIMSNQNYEDWDMAVAGDDRILDLKFDIAKKHNIQPENVKIYVSDTKLETLVPDNVTLEAAGCFNPNVRTYAMYEFDSLEQGHGKVHRSNPVLVDYNPELGNSLGEAIRHFLKTNWEQPCLGHREFLPDGSRGKYFFNKYSDVDGILTRFQSGLAKIGLQKGDTMCIMAENREEWIYMDWACQMRGIIVVPLYDTLGPESTEYIMNTVNCRAICTSWSNVEKLAEVRKQFPNVSHMIVMDGYPTDKEFLAQNAGKGLWDLTMSSLEALGASNPVPDDYPDVDHVATYCFSSGTTGNPKGVILTNRNFLSQMVAMDIRIEESLVQPNDPMLSYLPLAHIFQRIVELGCLMQGGKTGYFSGDLKAIIEDIEALGPAFLHGVPRIWNKIHDKIHAGVEQASFVRRWLFNTAYSSGLSSLEAGTPVSSIWDALVFKKARAAFGGNIRLCLSGAAPLTNDVAKFMKLFIGDNVVEGYGLTETCGGGTCGHLQDVNVGHVGTPVPCVEIKLVDIPDMNYLTTDSPNPRGEIWMRGHNICKGYFGEPEKTAEAFPNNDGWFATGDVGMWLPNGNLQIIDRKKNIFKLSQGEYIRPEHIENITLMSKYVAMAFVYGDSFQTYLVGILVPDFEILDVFLDRNGLGKLKGDFNAIITHPKVLKAIKDDIEAKAVEHGLHKFERVRKFTLYPEEFTPESGILTPSMKLKRHHAKEFFQQSITRMYADAKM